MSSGEQPAPPEPGLVDSFLGANRTRRQAMMVLAGAATYMLVDFGVEFGADQWTQHVWPDSQTSIATVRGSRKRLLPQGDGQKSPWIAFGGLGRQYNLDQAEILAYTALGVPREAAMVGGLNHANQGISFEDNARCMQAYAAGAAGMKLLGHSMGMLTALKSALYMEQPTHIDEIIAVSSPSGIQDVYRRDEVEWLVRSGLQGDIAQKFAFDIIVDHTSNRRDFFGRIGDIVTRAAHNAPRGVSPMVYVDQLHTIYSEQAGALIDQLAGRGMITSETRIKYCKSPAGRDATVRADQACDAYATSFRSVGADFSSLVFDGGHADMPAACKAVSPWCRQAPDFDL